MALLAASLTLGGCKKIHRTDMTALDTAGMGFTNVEQLRQIQVTDAEVQQLAIVRQSGFTDQTCIELVRIARGRNQPFADGLTIAGLAGAGFQESSVLTLARLNQLGLWAGEAEAMKLAGLSEEVILDVARRRAAGLPVLSSAKVAALRNVGFSDAQLMPEIDQGITDTQADEIIARRNNAAGGHSFIHQTGRR